MIAEYERAKIIGVIGVASAMRPASDGERAQWRPLRVPLCAQVRGGGQARYEIIPDEARVVRQVFAWVGQHRLTIGSLSSADQVGRSDPGEDRVGSECGVGHLEESSLSRDRGLW